MLAQRESSTACHELVISYRSTLTVRRSFVEMRPNYTSKVAKPRTCWSST